MKFKHKTVTEEDVISNLLRWFDKTEFSGFFWYNEANVFASDLAKKHNKPLFVVAGIISAFSPMKHWEENKRLAKVFLTVGSAPGIYPDNLKKAKLILSAETPERVAQILNGKKQVRFYWNIFKPDEVTGVTIDRHALAVCFQYDKLEPIGENNYQMTDAQYKFFEDCYIRTGELVGILPHRIQAILWADYRNARNITYTINE